MRPYSRPLGEQAARLGDGPHRALVKKTRDEGYREKTRQGQSAQRGARTWASLGGATLDNEENYLIKKLFGGGLGVVSIENQARI